MKKGQTSIEYHQMGAAVFITAAAAVAPDFDVCVMCGQKGKEKRRWNGNCSNNAAGVLLRESVALHTRAPITALSCVDVINHTSHHGPLMKTMNS